MPTPTHNPTLLVLSESFLQHTIEVSFTLICETIEFIPDSVKQEILNQLSDTDNGEFCAEQTGGYTGCWRIMPTLPAVLMYDIVMWDYNHYQQESLNEELFIHNFGNLNGKHFYNKWVHTHKKNLLLMIAYFGKDLNHTQTFCNMLMEQVEKYKNNK